MECKLWCCKVLQLVSTMRTDIRLSQLLMHYHDDEKARLAGEMEEEWKTEPSQFEKLFEILDLQ
eukprot:3432336-Prymnesium_polylepis.2